MRCELVDPRNLLGPSVAEVDGITGTVVRAYHPEAQSAALRRPEEDEPREMTALGDGLWAVWLPDVEPDVDYRLLFRFPEESEWERQDPYRFPTTIPDFDLYLLGEGTHRSLWRVLGARPMEISGVAGFAFSVWAPNAKRVSLVGDFCHWDGRLLPMCRLGESGIFDLFVPGMSSGTVYKYEILGADGVVHLKADPVGSWAERPPATASRTFDSTFTWDDETWLTTRRDSDPTRLPMAIYEVHLGSWMLDVPDDVEGPLDPDKVGLNYRELARRLVAHVKKLGFNYLELLPIAEHPFSGSWGYQIAGYFAPTARFGDPDDFRFFVDYCHQNGVGVIIDWVPGHFVKDAHGLGRFDGSALYEHEDPRRGWHPDWDTWIFNQDRWEVRNFLLANALYWLEEFHIDGLRVDAVASMLYLDYSRKEGEWIPNRNGGRENLEAISLLQQVNRVIHEEHPGCFTAAEESTAWPGVTKAVEEGGLGFDLKWNMGWMHDTLNYFQADPLWRGGSHDQFTFAMVYEYSERFLNPLSHDEVVHGKGSLYTKMPGDAWRKLANLRALYAYQYTRPGKILLFMGSELASTREWNERTSLDWYLQDDPIRAGIGRFLEDLGKIYHEHACLWKGDPDPAGFQWIACHDRLNSIFCFERRLPDANGETPVDGDYEHLVIVLNLTPVPREGYRIGVPRAGGYRLLLSSDAAIYGGSDYQSMDPLRGSASMDPLRGSAIADEFLTQEDSADGYQHSMVLHLPPLCALILQPCAKKPKKTIKAVAKKAKKKSRKTA